jgi:hypothetical protein
LLQKSEKAIHESSKQLVNLTDRKPNGAGTSDFLDLENSEDNNQLEIDYDDDEKLLFKDQI